MKKLSKQDLRKQIRRQLAVLDPSIFKNAGKRACERLKPYFLESRPLAIFKSFPDEIDTSYFDKYSNLLLYPSSDPLVYAQQILELKVSLVLVPGLAFDSQGYRLGRGKGYYDVCIAALRTSKKCPRLVGICLKEQLLDRIPIEIHDQKVDEVIVV